MLIKTISLNFSINILKSTFLYHILLSINQQPKTFQFLWWANLQMQGQQCFLSESKSWTHFMSATMFAPLSEKAEEHDLVVF